jgi:hypothetical protein
MSRVMLGLVVACVGPAPLHGQAAKTMLVEPPSPLLPPTLGRLTRVADGEPGDGLGALNAPDFDPTERAVLTEDGIKRFARSEYTEDGKAISETKPRTDSTQHGTVTVYQFGDASGAMAAFDYFRNPKVAWHNEKIGSETGVTECCVVFRSGLNVVLENINRGGDVPMGELIAKLPKASGTRGLAPLLPTYLPAKGLQHETVKYSLGPAGYQATGGVLPPEIVGFDKAAEVVTSKYDGKGTLTLLLYPTPQIAGDHGRQIEAEMNREGSSAGTVKLRREGPLLLLTTGAWKLEEAQTIVENIHLRNELTWNKPMPLEFHSEVRKTVSLLTSIAIFCGLGALAAVVLALFFGGARAAIRVMQGKPAATEPEFLRIDLSGRAAAIQQDGSAGRPPGTA